MTRPRAAALGLVIGLAGVVLPLHPHAAAAVDICRASSSQLDLNGDGYDDAVVGDPYASVGGRAGAGAVVVLYGDADRRIGQGRRSVITQATVAGSNPEAGDHFGFSVAVEDIDRDGCADLLVGSPGEDWAGRADAGVVQLIGFTPDGRGGPGTPRTRLFDQGDLGGAVEPGDEFGHAVAMGGGGDDTAAIGAPGEDVGAAADAGSVAGFVVDGEEFVTSRYRTQGSGLPGVPEPDDRLGASVLVAPLWATDGTDVAVVPLVVAGAPGDTVPTAAGPVDGAGSVSGWDDVSGFEQQVTQDTPGVPGVAEAGDGFGLSLAFSEPSAGQDRQTPREVAVGAPGEDVGRTRDAGSVTVLEDVPGTGFRGAQPALTQDTAGFAGSVEAGDHFGQSVAFGVGRSSTSTLVIGVPDEDVAAVPDAGLVQVATLTGAGRAAEALSSYTENSAGTPGRVARNSHFGLAVAGIRGLAESMVAVSSPYQGAGSVFVVGDDDTTRAWVPGSGGIPASSGRFGWSLSGLQGQP